MTPRDVFARAVTAALLDGEWEYTAMIARLCEAIDGEEQPWMSELVRVVIAGFATAPAHAPGELAGWIFERPELWEALDDERAIVRFAVPAPEMAESRWDVPPLATVRELATWIGFDVDTLEALADRRGIARASSNERARHYRYAWVAKQAGGARLIEAPKWKLRTVQRRILDGIVGRIPPHGAAHGFREGRSVASFAGAHVGRAVVLRVDLQAFFASVFAARVRGIVHAAGYPEEVAAMIAALCTHRTPTDVLARAPQEAREATALARLRAPHLPQGAPTSGALANLAAYRLDVRVAAFAAKLGAAYTRYADDLVLSGDRALVRNATTIVARLATIAGEEGFSLNFRKTRVMTASDRQRIAGVVVNEKLSVARREVERLRAILHNCVRRGPASQNRDGRADFRAHLRGKVSWVASIDAAKGARLQVLFDRIDWGRSDDPADQRDEGEHQ